MKVNNLVNKPNCFLCKYIAQSYSPVWGYQGLDCALGLKEGSPRCHEKFEVRDDIPEEELEEALEYE